MGWRQLIGIQLNSRTTKIIEISTQRWWPLNALTSATNNLRWFCQANKLHGSLFKPTKMENVFSAAGAGVWFISHRCRSAGSNALENSLQRHCLFQTFNDCAETDGLSKTALRRMTFLMGDFQWSITKQWIEKWQFPVNWIDENC